MRVVLREKRQITLPAEICDALGLKTGDSLNVSIENGIVVARPGRKAGLDAMEAISRSLHAAGITEEELLEGGRQVRKELFREKYPELAARLDD